MEQTLGIWEQSRVYRRFATPLATAVHSLSMPTLVLIPNVTIWVGEILAQKIIWWAYAACVAALVVFAARFYAACRKAVNTTFTIEKDIAEYDRRLAIRGFLVASALLVLLIVSDTYGFWQTSDANRGNGPLTPASRYDGSASEPTPTSTQRQRVEDAISIVQEQRANVESKMAALAREIKATQDQTTQEVLSTKLGTYASYRQYVAQLEQLETRLELALATIAAKKALGEIADIEQVIKEIEIDLRQIEIELASQTGAQHLDEAELLDEIRQYSDE